MEGEVRQMQADMQALVEADLDAQQVHLSSLHGRWKWCIKHSSTAD